MLLKYSLGARGWFEKGFKQMRIWWGHLDRWKIQEQMGDPRTDTLKLSFEKVLNVDSKLWFAAGIFFVFSRVGGIILMDKSSTKYDPVNKKLREDFTWKYLRNCNYIIRQRQKFLLQFSGFWYINYQRLKLYTLILIFADRILKQIFRLRGLYGTEPIVKRFVALILAKMAWIVRKLAFNNWCTLLWIESSYMNIQKKSTGF